MELSFAGEKEDLAIKVFTGQEEISTLQAQHKDKFGQYEKLRASLKTEADYAKKGKDALKLMDLEAEIIKLNERIGAKNGEVSEARKKFRELVDKEIKK